MLTYTHSTLSDLRIAEIISDYLVKKVKQDKQAPYTFFKGAGGPPPVLISRMSNTNFVLWHLTHILCNTQVTCELRHSWLGEKMEGKTALRGVNGLLLWHRQTSGST